MRRRGGPWAVGRRDLPYRGDVTQAGGIADYVRIDLATGEQADMVTGLRRTMGITFVVVTHELHSIFTIADRVIMLDKRVKGMVETGDPKHLRDHSTNPWVRQFFNREAESRS